MIDGRTSSSICIIHPWGTTGTTGFPDSGGISKPESYSHPIPPHSHMFIWNIPVEIKFGRVSLEYESRIHGKEAALGNAYDSAVCCLIIRCNSECCS